MALSKPSNTESPVYTPGNARGFRVYSLLTDEGTPLLRKILEDELGKMKDPSLRKLLKNRKQQLLRHLNPAQKELLYPEGGKVPNNANGRGFDISLLGLLLEIIFKEAPHRVARERLLQFRNDNLHISSTDLSEEDFAKLWEELRGILVDLGGDWDKISERFSSRIDPDHSQASKPTSAQMQAVTGDHNISVMAGDNAVINIHQGLKSNSQGGGTEPSRPFPLEQCQEALRNHYTKRRSKVQVLPWSQKSRIDIQDIFTSVDLLAHSKMGNDFKGKPLQSIMDIFKSSEECLDPHHILIWGSAGIGKTTILAKLVTDWANIKKSSEVREKYDLVFELALREVKKSQSLVDCIFSQLLPYDIGFTQDDLSEFIKDNDRVLIILDGYDEFEVEESHDIYHLLNYKRLQNSTVIVTTTTTRISDVTELMDPDTRVEIVGFSPDNMASFVRNWFSNIVKCKEKGDALLQRITPTVVYTGILSVPFLLALTCLLWEEDRNIPLSDQVCPFYDQLVDYLAKKYKTKDANPLSAEEIEDTLSSLGELAFDGLLKNTLLFSEEDVKKYCKAGHEAPVHLGLLVMQENSSVLNPANQFSFSHKTMQEYFAGRHLASKLQNQDNAARKDTLCRCFPDLRSVLQLDNLLVFTCGRLGQDATFILSHLDVIYSESNVKHLEEGFYTFFKTTMPGSEWQTDVTLKGVAGIALLCLGQWNDYPHELRVYQNCMEVFLLCCYESGLTENFDEVLFKRNTIQFSGANPRLYSVLSRVIADGKKKVEQLRLINTQQYVLGSVLEQLHKLSNLTELNLRQSRLGQQKLNDTPKKLQRKLSQRQLSNYIADDAAKAPSLLAKCLPFLRLLKKFVISWNDLGPGDMKDLLPAMKQLKDLEEVFLSGNDLSNMGDSVAELVVSLPKLKVFKVYCCRLCLEELLQIASSLQQHCPDLELFDFQLNPVQKGASEPTIEEEEKQTVCAKLNDGVKVCWETSRSLGGTGPI